MALFGSAARRALRPDSDIDVLVELEPGHRLGLSAGAARRHDGSSSRKTTSEDLPVLRERLTGLRRMEFWEGTES